MANFKDLTDEEASTVSFALTCYLEDFELEIKKEERKTGPMKEARINHAKLARIIYMKIIPESLCGPWKLMDGTIIKPGTST